MSVSEQIGMFLDQKITNPGKKGWVGNSQSAFVCNGASNHSNLERVEKDYYATEPRALELLLELESFSKDVWEPAAGGGHLVDVLETHGHKVRKSDIVKRRADITELDFLTYQGTYDGDIITNPPYSKGGEFVLKALDTVTEGHKVAMFMKITFLEGQDRYNKLYSKYPPKKIYVAVKRLICVRNGDFENQPKATAIAYGWFIWEKGYKGKTELDFFNLPEKKRGK